MVDDSIQTSDGDDAPTEAELKRRWEPVGDDPDLASDLGYQLIDLDVLVTSNSDKKLMLLPQAEDWIEEDAYLIADVELGCDPLEMA